MAEPANVLSRIAPVVAVAAKSAARPGTELAAPLPTRHALPHAVHRLEDAAAHLAKVAEAARVLHTVGLEEEGGGGGGQQGGGAESVQVGQEALPCIGAVARRPEKLKV
jgi:hypothetical protein